MLNAGELDQRITMQSPAATVGALGQRTEAWSTVATLWAKATPLRGREFFAAGAMQSEAAVRFSIRYRTGINGTMRVLWRGVAHAIVAEPMDVDGGKHTLEIMASAGIRDGQA